MAGGGLDRGHEAAVVLLLPGRVGVEVAQAGDGGGADQGPGQERAEQGDYTGNFLVVEPDVWREEFVEAEAFAYLAARSLRGLPLTFPGTTGVEKPVLGGRLAMARPGEGARSASA